MANAPLPAVRPARFVSYLERLNRKERYHLLVAALNDGSPFKLGTQFREHLAQTIGVVIPEAAFCAMDFHIDWLYAAAVMAESGEEGRYQSPSWGDPPRNLNLNQEDVDLVVAFPEGDSAHLVLIEAKGVTSWTNKQMASKVQRLAWALTSCAGWVRSHLVVMSPNQPQSLGYGEWEQTQGSVHWLPLPLPHDLLRVVRCETDTGVASKTGSGWKLMPGGPPSSGD